MTLRAVEAFRCFDPEHPALASQGIKRFAKSHAPSLLATTQQ